MMNKRGFIKITAAASLLTFVNPVKAINAIASSNIKRKKH